MRLVDETGLPAISYDLTDLLPRRLPLPTPLSPQLYARKPIRIKCTGSYQKIISFILRVEKEMPLVALEAFSFKVQPRDADNQAATIVFEWPIRGEYVADAAKGGAKK